MTYTVRRFFQKTIMKQEEILRVGSGITQKVMANYLGLFPATSLNER
jgi:hypothetical protein